MNIKVAVFTVSEKSINTPLSQIGYAEVDVLGIKEVTMIRKSTNYTR